MKKTKSALALLLALLMVVGMLSGCAGGASNAPAANAASAAPNTTAPEAETPAAQGDQPVYRIGLAAMLTGDNALNGERMQKASEMVLAQYNEAAGYEKFILNAEDDQTSQEGALTAVQKLISDGCVAIIGPHRSSNALAVSDTVKNNGVSVLVGGTSVSIDGSNPYMFRTRASDAIMAEVAATFCKDKLGAAKVGLLHASDEYGSGGANTAMAYFEANGIEYVDQPHNVNDVDFSTSILALQAAGVDTVFIWTHDSEMAIIAQQLNTYLPDVPVIGSPGATLDNVLNLCEAEWVDGWYSVTDFVSTSTEAVVVDFVKAFKALYGETPDLYAAAYYGGAVAVCEAILRAEAKGEVTRDAVRDALAETDELVLPSGTFYCDEKNDLVHSCTIAKLAGKTPEFYDSVVLGK